MANPEHEQRIRTAATATSPDTDFAGCDLSGLRLPSAKLSAFKLAGANLRRADLSGAYLQSADLSHVNLAQARLVLADLRQAILQAASLKSADLNGAVLQNADLRDAVLTKCILTRCTLTGADLTNADLDGADLRGIRGATDVQIQAAKNWRKAIFDPPTARSLGIDQVARVGRHGKPSRKPASRSIAVDIVCASVQPTFGDLFVICGDVHPRFPPTGNCDLSALAALGFQQTDDFFAVPDSNGDPIIWLYPLARGKPVLHHSGAFEGVRLQLPRVTRKLAPRFLAALAAFADALGGTMHEVIGERQGDPTTLSAIQSAIDSKLAN